MQEKILVAFDGSPASHAAIHHVAHLLGVERPVIVFTAWQGNLVLPDMDPGPDPQPHLLDGGHTQGEIQAAHQVSQQVARAGADLARGYGLQAETQTSQESIPTAAAILRAISHPEVCLLVIGSRRHGALGSALLGSVTQALLHQIVTPMLVVRPPGG